MERHQSSFNYHTPATCCCVLSWRQAVGAEGGRGERTMTPDTAPSSSLEDLEQLASYNKEDLACRHNLSKAAQARPQTAHPRKSDKTPPPIPLTPVSTLPAHKNRHSPRIYLCISYIIPRISWLVSRRSGPETRIYPLKCRILSNSSFIFLWSFLPGSDSIPLQTSMP